VDASAEAVRAFLFPFILALAAALIALLAVAVLQRGVTAAVATRRRRHESRYHSTVDAWLMEADAAALERLASVRSSAHRTVIGDLLVQPMRAFSGEVVARAGVAVERLGFVDAWIRDLAHRRWWRRSAAARMLGLARAPRATEGLVTALGDDHTEVRAAAVEALGRIADPATIPVITTQLRDPARHQRVRVIEALRAFGAAAAQAVARYGDETPTDRALTAEVLGWIGSATALGSLLAWCGDDDAATRAAALRAIGSIGVDDRAYYYALRALGDPAADVRAMAARALGRSRRADALPYLARCLDDEWIAAAHAARAVQQLGPPGLPYLTACVERNGPGAAIARQMLWEGRQRA
jgi:HEAT repeat protein